MTDRRRIAVTNLAWPATETTAALRLLGELGVGGVEIAPAQAGLAWDDTLPEAAARLGTQVAAAGLRVAGLQGWLFGVPDMALFGPPAARAALAAHLRRVAALAGQLGAAACVWGAPRSRDPGPLAPEAAFAEAAGFLRDVAADFRAQATVLAFEANAPTYGCRFVTRTAEAFALAAAVDRPGIGAQLDTGTVFLNGEVLALGPEARHYLAHVHVSEPGLAPLGTTGAAHVPVAGALRELHWEGWISIEMKAADDWTEAISRAVALVAAVYP